MLNVKKIPLFFKILVAVFDIMLFKESLSVKKMFDNQNILKEKLVKLLVEILSKKKGIFSETTIKQ